MKITRRQLKKLIIESSGWTSSRGEAHKQRPTHEALTDFAKVMQMVKDDGDREQYYGLVKQSDELMSLGYGWDIHDKPYDIMHDFARNLGDALDSILPGYIVDILTPDELVHLISEMVRTRLNNQ